MAESLPTAGFYVDDNLVNLFQTTMNQLRSDLGRNITIYLAPTASGCPNCGIGPGGTSNGIYDASNPYGAGRYNRPFPTGGICPVCRGTHEILTTNTAIHKALIGRAPKDIDFDKLGIEPTNVYVTKTGLDSWHNIIHAKKAVIDGEHCVRLRDPIKTGLRDLFSVRCWWRKQT